MATATVGEFLHRLTRGMVAEVLGVESDRQLVERVLATRDESALRAIVLRHGAMVYHVCRRVLRHPQDAEDAFQATFLVLAQQLHALRRHGSLAGWLYGVALRVSRKARTRALARRRREAGAARPEAVPPDDLTWAEVRSALDVELSRLPDEWRLPLVLCHLEGRTQDEAADHLGWSKSTLRRRLEQARAALGDRLRGRGIAWSAVLPAVLASDPAAAATVPACLDSTVAGALAVVNGKSPALAASAEVAVLTKGVLTTMLVKKIGAVAGVLGVLALATAVVGGAFSTAAAAPAEAHAERGSRGPEEHPALPVGLLPLQVQTAAQVGEPGPLTLKGHTSSVLSVCFSPDGKRIVTGGGELPRGLGGAGGNPQAPGPGEVKVWDAATGAELLALKGHTARVTGVCFSPDGKRVASAGADQTVRVWDAAKGQVLFSLAGQTRSVGSACFSSDGTRLATIGLEHVKVWDAETGRELLTLVAPVRPSGSVCFSPDGTRLASLYPWNVGGRLAPGEIKVWDAAKGQELLGLKGHTDFVFTVCFSPDGTRLASAAADQTVRVWDAAKGQELLSLKVHTSAVCSACFSPDGTRLASASWDRTAKVWDAATGRDLLTLKGHTDLLRDVCFSPDGTRLATASKDQTVKVWSLGREK